MRVKSAGYASGLFQQVVDKCARGAGKKAWDLRERWKRRNGLWTLLDIGVARACSNLCARVGEGEDDTLVESLTGWRDPMLVYVPIYASRCCPATVESAYVAALVPSLANLRESRIDGGGNAAADIRDCEDVLLFSLTSPDYEDRETSETMVKLLRATRWDTATDSKEEHHSKEELKRLVGVAARSSVSILSGLDRDESAELREGGSRYVSTQMCYRLSGAEDFRGHAL